MLPAQKCTKMKFCSNQVKKCCGCLDIRTGAYLIAFLSLIRVFVYLLFILGAFPEIRNYILQIIGGTLLLITIDIILIVGLVKNRVKYLNIWLFIEGFIILVRIISQSCWLWNSFKTLQEFWNCLLLWQNSEQRIWLIHTK